MAPHSSSWRRPYTSIYDDNYRYGSSLYSNTLSNIGKKYTDSLSKTQLRSDRPDLNLTTFAGSSLTPAVPAPAESSPGILAVSPSPKPSAPSSPTKDHATFRGSTFESRLSSALHSSYLDNENIFTKSSTSPERRVRNTDLPRPQSLYDDASAYTFSKVTNATTESDEVGSKRSAKKIGKEPSPSTQNGPAFWKDRCRDLQNQVDFLTQAIGDLGSKVKGDLSTTKSQLHSELADLHATVEQSSQQTSDLQKVIKRQANQLMEFQSAYDDLTRQFQDAMEEMGGWQRRCHTIKREMDRLRGEVEEALQKNSAARTVESK